MLTQKRTLKTLKRYWLSLFKRVFSRNVPLNTRTLFSQERDKPAYFQKWQKEKKNSNFLVTLLLKTEKGYEPGHYSIY